MDANHGRGVFFIVLSLSLALAVFVTSFAGSVQAATVSPGGIKIAALSDQQSDGMALYAILVNDPSRLDQAQADGLVLYSHILSARGDYLLVGADPEEGRRVDTSLVLLDSSPAGNSYYLAHPTRHSQRVSWSDYGSVLFDFGDQVLLRASPRLAERLPELGIKIAHIELQSQPWPASLDGAQSMLAVTPDPNVQAMLSQVSLETIYTYTAQLSGAQSVSIGGAPYTISRRYTYSGTPIQKAGQYVGEHLQARGLNVEYHAWGTSGTPSMYPNVIGQITGSTNPGDIYIIGAHLDDVPTFGTAPGADDNASGSVGTLIAADILSQYQWSCTLRFAFWTGEEQGLYGSAAYATPRQEPRPEHQGLSQHGHDLVQQRRAQ